jgi:hypothetical protein
MAEQGGLLDFLNSPGGMGLLSAVGAGLAGARRGGTWNAVGSGLLGGVQGYAQAQDMQSQMQRQKAIEGRQSQMFDWQKSAYEQQQATQRQQQQQQADRLKYLGTIGQYPDDFSTQQVKFDPLKYHSMGGSLDEAGKIAEIYNPKPMSVKEGESLINPSTFEPVFTAPKQAAPTELARLTQEMNALPPGSPLRATYQAAITKATTHSPGSNVSINMGQKGLENEFKLRDGFKGEPVYKAHQEMQAAYGQIRQSLGQASPAGDLAGATKIMKLLDPGSVVRESELGMAMAASGALDRLQYYAQNVLNGTKLTPTQRKDFQTLADKLYGESVNQYNAKRSEYERLGGEYGLNAGRSLGPSANMPTQPKAAAGMPSQDAVAAELARRGIK